MNHSFNVALAERYGILEAVIINHFLFWIAKNEANGMNHYDGHYWTYNSVKAFGKLFPYASERQIQYALKHLIDEGILQTGNYNKKGFDRTLWYAFTDFGISILHECQMDFTNLSNALHTDVEPIPDINTDIKPDIKPDIESAPKKKRFVKPTLEEVKAYCTEKNYNIDPERFIDYYESNGWKVGRNPMKDWKAAVRTWASKDREERKNRNEYVDPNEGVDLSWAFAMPIGGTYEQS